MSNKPIVFVSSVSKELHSTRDLVAKTLITAGYEPKWEDITNTEAGNLCAILRRWVDECHAVIQIVGHCAGQLTKDAEAHFGPCSYTQYEALYAHSKGKPVYYIVLDKKHPTDAHDPETPEQKKLQTAYRKKVLTHTDLYHPSSDLTKTENIVLKLKLNLGFDLRAYAREIRNKLAPLPLAQIVNDRDTPAVAVTDVFVPLMVRRIANLDPSRLAHSKDITDWDGREHQHPNPDELHRQKKELDQFLRSSPAENAITLLESRPRDNFILLGEAGGGKTLLARHLTVRWAQAFLKDPDLKTAGRLPIYIELKDYARALHDRTASSLLDYVASRHFPLHSLSQSALEQHLSDGSAYFILDGLDEVLDRSIKAKIIHDLIFTSGFDWDVVLTSRIADFTPADWQKAQNWHTYRIEPLGKDDQVQFIQRYHLAFFPVEKERDYRIQRLQGKLRDFHRLAELAGTPLLLTLLCLVNRAPALPETRTELYEQAAELLLHDWDFFHFEHGDSLDHHRLDPLAKSEKHAILRRLAWLLMHGRPALRPSEEGLPADSSHLSANLFPIRLVTEAVCTVLQELGKPNHLSYAELVPELLVKRNSVLCPASEGKQSFIHRTFLEFYAAWAWNNDDAPWLKKPKPVDMTAAQRFKALFVLHWQDPAWRVILILHLGRIESASYADELIQKLLLLPKKTEKNARHEALLLAAECFSETPQRGKLRALDEQLRSQLIALAEVKWLEVNEGSLFEPKQHREHCSQAVRALVQLWGKTPEIQAWLINTLHEPDRMTTLRVETVRQLSDLYGSTESFHFQLHKALVTAGKDDDVRNVVCCALVQGWGQVGLYAALANQPELQKLESLDLSGCTGLRSTQGLPRLPTLKELCLMRCTGLDGEDALQGLDGLAQLEGVYLHGCTGLRSIQGLPPLPALKKLNLQYCTGLRGEGALQGLVGRDKLELLDLSGCTWLRSTQGLPPLPALKKLWLDICTGLDGEGVLQGLVRLPKLEELYLRGCTELRSTQGLPRLPELKTLWLDDCTGLEGAGALQGLAGLPKLKELYLDGCTGLRSTHGLPPLRALKKLNLNNCTGLEGDGALQGLAGLPKLKELYLDGCTGLVQTDGLAGLESLTMLHLSDCSGLQGRRALQGLVGLKQLEELYLYYCDGISDEDVKWLREQPGFKAEVYR